MMKYVSPQGETRTKQPKNTKMFYCKPLTRKVLNEKQRKGNSVGGIAFSLLNICVFIFFYDYLARINRDHGSGRDCDHVTI